MTATPALSSSSSESFVPKPLTHKERGIYKKLDAFRLASSVTMMATFVTLVVTTVFIGLAQARLLPPTVPLYVFGGSVGLLVITILIDQCLRSVARKNNVDLIDYFQARQRLPPSQKSKKTKKASAKS